MRPRIDPARSGLAIALVLAACQTRAPRLPAPPAPLPREVAARILPAAPEEERTGPAEALGVPLIGTPDTAGVQGAGGGSGPLTLDDVLVSVERSFPLVLAALTEVDSAEASLLRARGGFDTRLVAKGKADVEGFYENERFDLGLEQPTTLWGATFSTGWRYGSGDFAVYDGEAKTDEGGELRAGVTVPLLRGRTIDPARVATWRALVERERAEPIVAQKRLESVRKAADAYWSWVSAGRRRAIALELLELARTRQAQVDLAVEEGELAPIASDDNRRSIVERETALVQSERRLEQAAIALSLYWRDADGRPLVPGDALLPESFPAPRDPALTLVPDDVSVALERRPELRALALEIEGLELQRDLGRNDVLPQLDVGVFASQDVGAAVDDPDDKGPFELELGFRLDVPLQRRSPRGALLETEAKLNRLRRELQFAREVAAVDVRDAVSALTQSWRRLEQARENVELAQRLAEAERVQLEAGESDLFRVNVREQQAALAAAGLVDVLDVHFRSLARYTTVLGVPWSELAAGARAAEGGRIGG